MFDVLALMLEQMSQLIAVSVGLLCGFTVRWAWRVIGRFRHWRSIDYYQSPHFSEFWWIAFGRQVPLKQED